jgi:hypothetical protein
VDLHPQHGAVVISAPARRGAARRFVAFALLLLSSLLAAAPAAVAAPAVDGISARAVDADGQPLGHAFFVEHRNPGSKFVGHIAISNAGKRFARLYVDPVDALTSDRGGTVFAARDAAKKGVATWMSVDKQLIRLDPGDTKTIAFTVRVPGDATPGDHVGGVAVQPLRDRTTGGQFSVTQVLRVAIATQVVVRGPAEKALTPKVLRLEAIAGSEVPALYIRLANVGQLLCQPTVTATLYQDGQPLSSEKRDVDTILAGKTIDYPLYWPRGLRAGKYQAAVRTEKCGKTQETQADVELARDLSGTTPQATTGLAPAEPGDGFPTWAIIVLGVAGVAILLFLVWFVSRRAARKEREKLLAELRAEGAASGTQGAAAGIAGAPAGDQPAAPDQKPPA